MADIGKNICNMIECRAGEHCLFRSFGLGGIVDDANRITRNILQVEINKWYPGNAVKDMRINSAMADGSFVYTINISGE